jgi:hypothetical protein
VSGETIPVAAAVVAESGIADQDLDAVGGLVIPSGGRQSCMATVC